MKRRVGLFEPEEDLPGATPRPITLQAKAATSIRTKMVSLRLNTMICAGLVAASSLVVMAQNDAGTEKPPPARLSADEDLKQLFRRAREYWDKGDYTNALPLYERILAISQSTWGKDNPELAKQLILIGTIHSSLGEPDKALLFFKRFVEITDKAEVEKSFEEGLFR